MMEISQLIGKRYKERPAETTLESHAILLRGGYIRQVANGIYSLLPLGLRVMRKIEGIIRREMDALGGQEILMPVVLPKELWEESGRYLSIGSELLRFSDRTGHSMLLAMTHEEAVVHLIRNEVNSYRSYPLMLYQIQTKFRDESRSRGGLIRLREFTMKDAYSFHTDKWDLAGYYERMKAAYMRVFSELGIPQVVELQSDPGMMGGETAHEYMLLTDAGEDTVVTCSRCGHAANLEIASGQRLYHRGEMKRLEKVSTPGAETIEEVSSFLGISAESIAKAVFYERDADGYPVLALIRGDLDVNERKLARIIRVEPMGASEGTIAGIGGVPGYASGMNLRDCRILADVSVKASTNLAAGADETGHHYLNFNLDRDLPEAEVHDISMAREGDGCAQCGGHLVFGRGIEVGNIFELGTKYTGAMGMRYLDQKGREGIPYMGCYGIGVSRLVSSIIEARHDKYGPIWPAAVAPFQVHLISLNLRKAEETELAQAAYRSLAEAGYEVVFDDRDERPGVKFADADLIGAPLRVVLSARHCADRSVEWRTRSGDRSGVIAYDRLIPFLSGFLEAETRSGDTR